MKKVIEGSLYHTETAQDLGYWSNDLGKSDFGYCEETLYRTKAGKYFLHGSGHAASKYAKSVGNNTWGAGEHIEPLSPQAAREWAEEKLSADEYSAIFGEPEEAGDGREPLGLTVPADVKRRLERLREETGKSISQIVSDAFSE